MNGWKNYATWRINLELCDAYIDSMVGYEQFPSIEALADNLDGYVEGAISSDGRDDGLAVDYARAFVSDVDFYEIARSAAFDNPQLIESDEDEDAA